MTKVHAPRNLLITKPPSTVLISGIPLCLAYSAYSLTRLLAQRAKNTCAALEESHILVLVLNTYRENDEKEILYDPFPCRG